MPIEVEFGRQKYAENAADTGSCRGANTLVVSAIPTIDGAPPQCNRLHTRPRVALTMMMNAQVNTSTQPETNQVEESDDGDAIDTASKIVEGVKESQTKCVLLLLSS